MFFIKENFMKRTQNESTVTQNDTVTPAASISIPTVMETMKSRFSPSLNTLVEIANAINGVSYAVAEFVDNSIDAKATQIRLCPVTLNGNLNLLIKDDGEGMTQALLRDAVTLGSTRKASRRNTLLGCKGMGLNSASYYLARRLLILTKSLSGEVSLGSVDFDYLNQNRYTNHWDKISKVEVFSEKVLRGNVLLEEAKKWLDKHTSGTVIILKDIKPQRASGERSLTASLVNTTNKALSLSYIYRWKLNKSFSLFYDDSKIQPTGPGLDFQNNTKKDHVYFLNDNIDGWIRHEVQEEDGTKTMIRVRFTHLGKIHTSNKGGVRILRFSRDVTPRLLRGFWNPDYNLGHLIVEIDCPASFLDKHLNVGIDKVINGITNNAPEDFEFTEHFRRNVLSHRLRKIAAFNVAERRKEAIVTEKHIQVPEILMVHRYKEMLINSYKLQGKSRSEIAKMVRTEFPTINGLRVDLKDGDKYYEFKNHSTPGCVGQVFSYLSALPHLEKYTLVVPKLTNALQKQIEMMTSKESGFVRKNGVSFEIEVIDLSQKFPNILNPEMTKEEVNFLKRKPKKK